VVVVVTVLRHEFANRDFALRLVLGARGGLELLFGRALLDVQLGGAIFLLEPLDGFGDQLAMVHFSMRLVTFALVSDLPTTVLDLVLRKSLFKWEEVTETNNTIRVEQKRDGHYELYMRHINSFSRRIRTEYHACPDLGEAAELIQTWTVLSLLAIMCNTLNNSVERIEQEIMTHSREELAEKYVDKVIAELIGVDQYYSDPE
jgi:hypothetical protein